MSITLISLPRTISFPADFREAVREFNRGLVATYFPFALEVMTAFPGTTVKCVADAPSGEDEKRYEQLLAERAEYMDGDHAYPHPHVQFN